jgi:hypothetical protein
MIRDKLSLISPKKLLLHYHIYKNAGSSLDTLLRNNFGMRWLSFEGSQWDSRVSTTELLQFLSQNPDATAISSHSFRLPTPGANIYPIVMLRHPIDRCRSIYHYAKMDSTQYGHAVAASTSFKGYVRWSLDTEGENMVVRNYQVMHLSNAPDRYVEVELAQPNAGDLAEAKKFLQAAPAFGIVRRFGISCRLIEHTYRPIFPGLSLQDIRENVSDNSSLSEQEAINATRDELGEDTFLDLVNANLLDLALYNFAKNRFQELLALHDLA